MPTSAEPLLLDTSAAIALVSRSHAAHEPARSAAKGRTLGLAGHAVFETFSVLTRLPAPQRLTPAAARTLITTNFPHWAQLSASSAAKAVGVIAEARIAGGAVYDALVALAAREHGFPLLTCDQRAVSTYRAIGVEFELVPSS